MDSPSFEFGLFLGSCWPIMGLIIVYLGRNRLIRAIAGFGSAIAPLIMGQIMADIANHPENVKPAIDAVMKSVLSNPNGILPKEATVKLPIIGRVPASWFEPLVKKAVEKGVAGAAGEAGTAVKSVFG